MKEAELMAMSENLYRVLSEDVHAAASVSTLYGQLNLIDVNGGSYRYLVNRSGQYVRIKAGGGTAVLAQGIQSVQVTVSDSQVTLDVNTRTDGRETIQLAALDVMDP
ncbi:hypothetical protein LLE49_02315 [Alicyclobacillus tolerans]|uniref:hypothetical protein n=1 Tax=Alicyclobacillus tolerans TaxID=90970 RepID=UPI001F3ECFB5|nr:hypothetical protein [Alicyclobacillus tolerans]MCF8563571.1 hypothetical protein [Alicyclobacillus tolerans]